MAPASDQQRPGTASANLVPSLVNLGGVLTDQNGKALTGVVGVTFYLYKDSEGGSPLWIETQNVEADATGRYSVVLGFTTSQGLPAELFASGEARWLGIQPQGRSELPRILLVSVPYALKAADAETIGGLPPSAFVLATPAGRASNVASTSSTQSSDVGSNPVTTAGGSVNQVAVFDAKADISSSQISDNGTNVGIGTTSPSAKLEVKGSGIFRGSLSLPSIGIATAAAGASSQPLNFAASAFNSGTNSAISQKFQWQAEPTGNNTKNPAASFNLLVASNGSKPLETGLGIRSNGQVTFAPGQTFPGAGTITGVTAGSGLGGGGTNGIVTLSLTTTCTSSQVLQWDGKEWICANIGGSGTITGVVAGTDLSGGGNSGSVTLNLDTSKVPQLMTSNTFSGTQIISGGDLSMSSGNLDLPQTVAANAGVINVGGQTFMHACCAGDQQNTFIGFGAGDFALTGNANTGSGYRALAQLTTAIGNTASGASALYSNSTGDRNTATGASALFANTTGTRNSAHGEEALATNVSGSYNTASGYYALYDNTGSNNTGVGYNAGSTTTSQASTGSNNTFIGYLANPGVQTSLTNATAIGANAEVTESNALVLGSVNGTNGATASVNVGIGTTAPRSILEAQDNAPGALGPTLTLTNTGGNGGAAVALDFNSYAPSSSGTYNPAARIEADDDQYSDDIVFKANKQGSPNQGLQTTMTIHPNGNVDLTGLVSFAPGQTFPGAGTVTGVTAGSGLSGGGTNGSVTLGLTTTCASGQVLQWNGSTWICTGLSGGGTITGITAGTDLTGGGTSGTVTLNLDTTKIPQLSTSNTFSGTQTINGALNLPYTTSATNGLITLSGYPLLHAYGAQNNSVFVGINAGGLFSNTGGGNTALGANSLYNNTSGGLNTAAGYEALYTNTSGAYNTAFGGSTLFSNSSGGDNIAIGYSALYLNTSGSDNEAFGNNALGTNANGNGNIAIGFYSGYNNTQGSNNTFLGYLAGPDQTSTNLSNATAIGANAEVTASNSLVLGGIAGVNGANTGTNVGIGTTAPRSILEAQATAPGALGPTLTLTNTGGNGGAAVAVDFNSYAPSNAGTYNPAARIEADDDQYSDDIVFKANKQGSANQGLQTTVTIYPSGNVKIAGNLTSDTNMSVTANGDLSLQAFGSLDLVGSRTNISNPVISGTTTMSGDATVAGTLDASLISSGSQTITGNLTVTGTVSKGSGSFKIDHPLDPANKYLYHSFVESPDMMNVYNGNITTDERGFAGVTLPEYFEALNRDFRYQLTVIGQFAQAIVAKEISDNQFTIQTNKPGVKVSWQVTGIRQDTYANAHRIPVEEEKPLSERGHYLHPELFPPSDEATAAKLR
jgi:hypothetical protein